MKTKNSIQREMRRTGLNTWSFLGGGWPDIETLPRCERFPQSFRESCSKDLREDVRRAWGVRPVHVSKSKNRITLRYGNHRRRLLRISCTVNGAEVRSWGAPGGAPDSTTTMVLFSRGVTSANARRTIRSLCSAAVEREMLTPSARRTLVEIYLKKSGRWTLANCPGLLDHIEREAARDLLGWPIYGDDRCYLDGALLVPRHASPSRALEADSKD
jgi:hypothetical protein